MCTLSNKEIQFSVAVADDNALIGQHLEFTYDITPFANSCHIPEQMEGAVITPVYCAPPITCTCPEGGVIYSVNPGVNETITLSQTNLPSTVSNACVELNGYFILDDDLTLENVTFVANPGSRIDIATGSVFTVKNTDMFSCNQMWRGITINNGATLDLDGVSLGDNSISDAQYAIHALNGSRLSVQNTVFDKNYIGVRVPPSQIQQTVNLLDPINFDQCLFSCSSNLLPAYNGQSPLPGTRTLAAFDLNNVNFFNIGTSGDPTIEMNGLMNGVLAYRSIFSLKGVDMNHFTGSSSDNWYGVFARNCKEVDIQRCDITDFRTGVRAIESSILVDRCNMKAYYGNLSAATETAIHSTPGNAKKTRITNNTITHAEIGVRLDQLTSPLSGSMVSDNIIHTFEWGGGLKAGVYLSGVKNIIFKNNDIGERTGSVSTGGKHHGFYAFRSNSNTFENNNTFSMLSGFTGVSSKYNYYLGNNANRTASSGVNGQEGFTQQTSSNNRFCCNLVDHMANDGFRFEGACTGVDLLQSQIYNANGAGLRLGQHGNLPLSNSTIIGDQIDAANRWLGAYGSFGAIHESDMPEIITSSKFVTKENWVPTWTTGVGNGVTWFIGQGTGTDSPCNCPLPSPLGGVEKPRRYNTDAATANEEYDTPYEDVYNWEAGRELFDRLDNYYDQIVNAPPPPGLNQQEINDYNALTQDLTQFYAANDTLLMGRYHDVAQQITLSVERDSADGADIQASFSEIQFWSDSLHQLSSMAPDPLQEALKTDAFSRLNFAAEQNDLIFTAISDNQTTAAMNILATNNALPDSTGFQFLERFVNALYLQGQFWKIDPTMANWAAIKSIADLCPLSDGAAVYQARAMYQRFDQDYTWDDESLCGWTSQRERIEAARSRPASSWILAPNPAQSSITITGDNQDGAQIQIVDIMGRTMFAGGVTSTAFRLDTQHWPVGLYFYHILNDKGRRQSGQIVIQR